VSTAVLLAAEVQELLKHPTWLKVGGLVLHVLIVVYLIFRVTRMRTHAPRMAGSPA
jgi:uncharacterized membrane protein (DUF2068 family)